MKRKDVARLNACTLDQLQGLARSHQSGKLDDSQFIAGAKFLLALHEGKRAQHEGKGVPTNRE